MSDYTPINNETRRRQSMMIRSSSNLNNDSYNFPRDIGGGNNPLNGGGDDGDYYGSGSGTLGGNMAMFENSYGDVDDEDRIVYFGPGADGLVGAVITQNHHRLKTLLQNSKITDQINERHADLRNRTALHCAVMSKDEASIKLLVGAGASVGENVDDDGDETPLTMAIMYIPKMLPFMIENGKQRNLRRVDTRGQNLLHRIVSKHGGGLQNPKCHVLNERTVSKFQGQWDRLTMVRKLVVEEGLSLKQRDEKGFTPSEWARENFLGLGPDAATLIEFLESASSAGGPLVPGGGLGGKSSFLTIPPVYALRRFFSHPITRIVMVVLLLVGHVIQYAIEPVDREFGAAVSLWGQGEESALLQGLTGIDPNVLALSASSNFNLGGGATAEDEGNSLSPSQPQPYRFDVTGPWTALYQSRVVHRVRELLEAEGFFTNGNDKPANGTTSSPQAAFALFVHQLRRGMAEVAEGDNASTMVADDSTTATSEANSAINSTTPTAIVISTAVVELNSSTAEVSNTSTEPPTVMTTVEVPTSTTAPTSSNTAENNTSISSSATSSTTSSSTVVTTVTEFTTGVPTTMTAVQTTSTQTTLVTTTVTETWTTLVSHEDTTTESEEELTTTTEEVTTTEEATTIEEETTTAEEATTEEETTTTTTTTTTPVPTTLPPLPDTAAAVTFQFLYETYPSILGATQVEKLLHRLDQATGRSMSPRLSPRALAAVMGSFEDGALANVASSSAQQLLAQEESEAAVRRFRDASSYLSPSSPSRDDVAASRVSASHPLQSLPNVLMSGFCSSGLVDNNPKVLDRQLAIFHVVFSIIDMIGFGWNRKPANANDMSVAGAESMGVPPEAIKAFNTTDVYADYVLNYRRGVAIPPSFAFPAGNRPVAIASRVFSLIIGILVGIGLAFLLHEVVLRRLLRLKMFGANTSVYVSRGRRVLLCFSVIGCAYLAGLVHNAILINKIAPNAQLALSLSTAREVFARNWTLSLAEEAAKSIIPSIIAANYSGINFTVTEEAMDAAADNFIILGTEYLPLGETPLLSSASAGYYDDYDVLRDLSVKPCLPRITPIRALKGFFIVAALIDFVLLWSLIDAMFQSASFKQFVPATVEKYVLSFFPKKLRMRYAKRGGWSPIVRLVLFWAVLLLSVGIIIGLQFLYGDFLPHSTQFSSHHNDLPFVFGDSSFGNDASPIGSHGNTDIVASELILVNGTGGGAPFDVALVTVGQYKSLINTNTDAIRDCNDGINGEDFIPPIVTAILIFLSSVITVQEWSFTKLSSHFAIFMPGTRSMSSTGWWLWFLVTCSLVLDIRLYVAEVTRYVNVVAARNGNSYAYWANNNATSVPKETTSAATASSSALLTVSHSSTVIIADDDSAVRGTLLQGASAHEIGLLVAMLVPAFIAFAILSVAVWVSSLRCCKGPTCWKDQSINDTEVIKEVAPPTSSHGLDGMPGVAELGGIGIGTDDDANEDEELENVNPLAKMSEKRAKEFAKLEENAAGGAFGPIKRAKPKDINQNPDARRRAIALQQQQQGGKGGGGGGGGGRGGAAADPTVGFATVGLAYDIWHCAYTDDAVRMCSILEQHPELLDARGGFGLICDHIARKVVYCYDFETGARGYAVQPFAGYVNAMYARYGGADDDDNNSIPTRGGSGGVNNGGSMSRQRLLASKGLTASSVRGPSPFANNTTIGGSPNNNGGVGAGGGIGHRAYAITVNMLQAARQKAANSAMQMVSATKAKVGGAGSAGGGGGAARSSARASTAVAVGGVADGSGSGGALGADGMAETSPADNTGGATAAGVATAGSAVVNIHSDPTAAAVAGAGGGGGATGSDRASSPPATGGLSDEAINQLVQKAMLPIPTHPFAATPLHYAIAGKARSTMASLINRGANVRLRTTHGLHNCQQLADLCDSRQFIEMMANK